MKFIPYAQCKTPVSKALYWKREAQYQSDMLDGYGLTPSYERDITYDAWVEAKENRRGILMRERSTRLMERGT